MRIAIAASILMIFSTVQSSAALLRSIEGGRVAVNAGYGFVTTSSPTTLKPGDKVRASATGRAEIVYDNGCIEPVRSNQIVVVTDEPQCRDDGALWVLGGIAVAGGAAAIILSGDDKDKPGSP